MILSFAREVKDFRTGNRLVYPSSSIIFMAVVGMLCNAQEWSEVVDIAEASEDILKHYLGEDYVGVPSHDTFARFFALIHPTSMESAFRTVMNKAWEKNKIDKECIAIDGKYLCGVKDETALNMVSAYATDSGLCLGQAEADKKLNEPEILRKLVTELKLEGSVITADALHCQNESIKEIIKQKSDYLITVKGNQQQLFEGIQEGIAVEKVRAKKRYIDHAEEFTRGHGREERRICHACSHLGWLPSMGRKWEGIQSFGTVTSYRTVLATGETSQETRCFISSLPMNALQQMGILRNHWKIENNLHWQLDVTYGEDLTRMKKNQLLNVSILRKLVMPVVREFTYKKGTSLKKKMFVAILNKDIRRKLIQALVDFYQIS